MVRRWWHRLLGRFLTGRAVADEAARRGAARRAGTSAPRARASRPSPPPSPAWTTEPGLGEFASRRENRYLLFGGEVLDFVRRGAATRWPDLMAGPLLGFSSKTGPVGDRTLAVPAAVELGLGEPSLPFLLWRERRGTIREEDLGLEIREDVELPKPGLVAGRLGPTLRVRTPSVRTGSAWIEEIRADRSRVLHGSLGDVRAPKGLPVPDRGLGPW